MHQIVDGLLHLAVDVAGLHEDPVNARRGHAVERIAAMTGQTPVLVNDGTSAG